MEENKYENIIEKLTEEQLIFERVIKLKQQETIRNELNLLDKEYKKRLEKKKIGGN